MKTPVLAALFALLAAGPALAGASSENQIDPQSLQGPKDGQANTADPGNSEQANPGAAGHSSQPQDLRQGQSGGGATGGASTGAGTGTSGSSGATTEPDANMKARQPAAQ
jgi:hypothetical protein